MVYYIKDILNAFSSLGNIFGLTLSRQIDIYSYKDRQKDRQKDRYIFICIKIDRQKYIHIKVDRYKDRQLDRQKYRQIDRKTYLTQIYDVT